MRAINHRNSALALSFKITVLRMCIAPFIGRAAMQRRGALMNIAGGGKPNRASPRRPCHYALAPFAESGTALRRVYHFARKVAPIVRGR